MGTAAAINALAGQAEATVAMLPAEVSPEVSGPAITEEDIDRFLLKLVADLRRPVNQIRRAALMDASESRQFWKGNQHGTWLDSAGAYVDVVNQIRVSLDDDDDEDLYAFVYNIYQAAGLILMAPMLAAGVPGTQFVPENGNDRLDREAAENAWKIRDYLHRQPWFGSLKKRVRTLHLLYTDGLVVAYTRHLRSQDFGMEKYDKVAVVDQQLRPAGYDCECGNFTIAASPDAPDTNGLPPMCEKCGASLEGQPQTAAVMAKVPQVTGQESVPAGREVVDLFGVLETVLPHREDEAAALPWIGIEVDVDAAELRAAYRDKADKINPGFAPESEDAELASRLRLQAQAAPNSDPQIVGSGDSKESCTYSRFWIRPKTFFSIKDAVLRDLLVERFPKGVRLEFTGNVVLAKQDESLDQHISLIHAYPGDGVYKPSLGGSLKDPQEILNNGINLGQEAEGKAAFPPVYRDAELISDAGARRKARPGEDIPVKLPPNKTLRDCTFQPNWKSTDQSIADSVSMGREAQQELTGAVGALAGESMENMRTARGYAQAGRQANQRLALAYGACNIGWAEIDRQLVLHFVENRVKDVSYTIPRQDGSGDFDVREIALEQSQGKFSCIYPESDESVPVTQEQQAAAITSLLQSGNETIAAWVTQPDNLAILRRALGLRGLKIPGEDYKNRTLRIIGELLKQQPIQSLVPGAQLGGAGQVQTLPSIQLDPFLDDPGMVTQFVRDWCVSNDGARAERQNPAGWQNVLAYGRMAMQIVQMQQMQAQAQQAAQQEQRANADHGRKLEEKQAGKAPAEKPQLPPPGADQASIPTQVM